MELKQVSWFGVHSSLTRTEHVKASRKQKDCVAAAVPRGGQQRAEWTARHLLNGLGDPESQVRRQQQQLGSRWWSNPMIWRDWHVWEMPGQEGRVWLVVPGMP
ncbi:uncharacterized protein LOC133062087 [Dama dama]|uniref:uncharacterized protein LOC133062087 n=1 Tax=Dama dama TaxID=30532 RepID=UPI002A35B2BC|nr:uncharacterized protein LOC133062087 [Dama dama]